MDFKNKCNRITNLTYTATKICFFIFIYKYYGLSPDLQ